MCHDTVADIVMTLSLARGRSQNLFGQHSHIGPVFEQGYFGMDSLKYVPLYGGGDLGGWKIIEHR